MSAFRTFGQDNSSYVDDGIFTNTEDKDLLGDSRMAGIRFRRAIERRALWMARTRPDELPNLPLEDALQLVHLYAERGSPKYEKAALRWLERYLTESSPRLRHFAEVATDLAKLDAREPN